MMKSLVPLHCIQPSYSLPKSHLASVSTIDCSEIAELRARAREAAARLGQAAEGARRAAARAAAKLAAELAAEDAELAAELAAEGAAARAAAGGGSSGGSGGGPSVQRSARSEEGTWNFNGVQTGGR
jgi:hypothetical protein